MSFLCSKDSFNKLFQKTNLETGCCSRAPVIDDEKNQQSLIPMKQKNNVKINPESLILRVA